MEAGMNLTFLASGPGYIIAPTGKGLITLFHFSEDSLKSPSASYSLKSNLEVSLISKHLEISQKSFCY